MYFYDMEIVEEEVFLKWKEDITDFYPGKGKALFQVECSSKIWSLFTLGILIRSSVPCLQLYVTLRNWLLRFDVER